MESKPTSSTWMTLLNTLERIRSTFWSFSDLKRLHKPPSKRQVERIIQTTSSTESSQTPKCSSVWTSSSKNTFVVPNANSQKCIWSWSTMSSQASAIPVPSQANLITNTDSQLIFWKSLLSSRTWLPERKRKSRKKWRKPKTTTRRKESKRRKLRKGSRARRSCLMWTLWSSEVKSFRN